MATGVEVRVGGKVLSRITDYSASEESTPVEVSDTTGATGVMTLELGPREAREVKRMRGKLLDLEDRGQGTTQGVVAMPSGSDNSASLQADSRLGLLSVNRNAAPYSGTLGGYFAYLLGLVGITSGYYIPTDISTRSVVYPGWSGSVWLYLKSLSAVQGVEVSLVSDLIVMRPLRSRVTVDGRDSVRSWSVDDRSLALSVEGYYYNNQWLTGGLAYPRGGWNEDVQVYQVDAGEVLEIDIEIQASLEYVKQPVSQNFVDKTESSDSVYCVMSNDGYPYSAAQWDAEGGKIQVSINEDSRSLTVKITGSVNPQYAPFRIAATAGPSDNYSSLRLIGRGVFFNKTLVSIPTGVDPDLASQEIGTTVDSPFISSETKLRDALSWSLARFGGSQQSISVTTSGINKTGQSGVYSFPPISDFNAFASGELWASIADFNAYYSGKTVEDFNVEWFESGEGNFENQAFGNIAGARTLRDGAWWRIRTATITPSSISYSAEMDTTLSDFNGWWLLEGVPQPVDDFNTDWLGYTVGDFNISPLEASE